MSRESDIYQQDGEFYRHQDTLMWGRFQTAALVEGLLLYGLYGRLSLNTNERHLLLFSGSALVLVLCLLSLKDRSDGVRHLARIREYEKGGPALVAGRWRIRGNIFMVAAIAVLNLTNLLLLRWHW